MPGSTLINVKIAGAIRLLVLLGGFALLAGTGCSPRVAHRSTLNPIEILDRSPRIYHISYAELGDSLETRRASAYLAGGLATELEIAHMDTASGDDPSPRRLAQIEYVKARRRMSAGARRAALSHIRKAIDIDPGFAPSYVLLAELLLSQNRVAEAAELFARYLAQDPTDSEALIGLSRCYMLMGKPENAKQALVDAVIFDRTNLDAWWNLYLLGVAQDFDVVSRDAPELGVLRQRSRRHYDLVIDRSLEACGSQTAAWIVFTSQRAVWRLSLIHI